MERCGDIKLGGQLLEEGIGKRIVTLTADDYWARGIE